MGAHAGLRPLGNEDQDVAPAKGSGGTETVIELNGKYYRVHSFTTVGNSTFTVERGGEVEYLIVAGGGGGGKEQNIGNNYGGAGGGGAGGLLLGSIIATYQAYAITVGAGGTGATTIASPDGADGENSSALGQTAIGGGGGGGWQRPGRPGGSGGGGGSNSGATRYSGGSGTSGQGFAGAENWFVSGIYSGGGSGGGATEPGKNRDTTQLVNNPGGSGLTTNFNGTTTTYATGGLGTYGGGTNQYGGSSGATNTGNGGDGGSYINAGNGGSGIVIVRYRIPKAEYDAEQ